MASNPPVQNREPDPLNIEHFVQELLLQKCPNVYYRTQAAVDRRILEVVLTHVQGNQVEAAEVLGISRNTLRARLRDLGLSVQKQVINHGGK